MVAMVIAAAVAMLVALVGTPFLIRALQVRGIGAQILEEYLPGHSPKAGTPTMGGLMIVIGAVCGYLAGHIRARTIFTWGGLFTMLAIAGAGAVGLIDDWLAIRHGRNLGLNKRAKLIGQVIVAVTFAVLAVRVAHVDTHLSFTRWNSLSLDLGDYVWVIWAVLLIVGTSNAVNLTDGLDGLAAGSSMFSFAAFLVIGFWQFRHPEIYQVSQALDLALVAAAMVGGCAGFLWWNAAPARIIMGDTGALAIGAGLASLALVTNSHLLLPIIGSLFVIETLSVMVQIGAFRLFNRRRVFKMAPIHHHFELLGWPETTVLIRFWILAGMGVAAALGIFYADFLRVGGID